MEEKYYKIRFKDRPDGSENEVIVKARSEEEAVANLEHQRRRKLEIIFCVEK